MNYRQDFGTVFKYHEEIDYYYFFFNSKNKINKSFNIVQFDSEIKTGSSIKYL